MPIWYTEDVRDLFSAVLSLETQEECLNFFDDVCTVREIIEMAQRLKVAKLLKDGGSYKTVNEATGVSTATISRVSRCLDHGNGGYSMVIERIKESQGD